jgi:hypothetical protein
MESNFPGQDPTMANRYLAGQLTAAEQAEYEALLLENPEALRELEAVARLKVGMARLQEQGKLAALIDAPANAGRFGLLRHPGLVALAASLMLAVVGALLWQNTQSRAVALVASLNNLQSHGVRSLVGQYTLVRTRAANAEVQIPTPPARQALELRILPDVPAGSSGYRVELYRALSDGSAEPKPLASSSDAKPGADSFVTLYANSELLGEGAYLLKVTPAGTPAAGASAESEVFQIRVAQPLTTPGSVSH